MKALSFSIIAAGLVVGTALAGEETGRLRLSTAFSNPALEISLTTNGRTKIGATIRNTSTRPLSIRIPAGVLFAAGDQDRLTNPREATLEIPAGRTLDATIPAIALSSANHNASQPARFLTETEPRLAPLLSEIAHTPDLSRATTQLTALAILENISFTSWTTYLNADPPEDPDTEKTPRPTQKDIAIAVDALLILRKIAPDRTFAIATDPQLKLKALRNPWSRAKAAQIYGLETPDAAVPNLSELLHTRPNDNCPVCRLRPQTPQGDL